MIHLERARQLISKKTRLLPMERVSLLSAANRILAADIYARENIPAFDRAAMDGYAVKADDTVSASFKRPAILEIEEDIPAGKRPGRKISSGKASSIMTGALIPVGTDAVIMVEDTEEIMKKTKEFVKVFCRVKKGGNISWKGEDIKKGSLVLEKGMNLQAAQIGILAALGKTLVPVRRQPRVSIITTGDELVKADRKPRRGQLRDSNGYTLYRQVQECGGLPMKPVIARDNKKQLYLRITNGIEADVLLLSGGVSVGKYDLVRDVLTELGVKPHFWRVAIKPAKPVFFGTYKKTLVFGLPGYPVSSMIAFEQLVRPAILTMLGCRKIYRMRVKAKLQEAIRKKAGRRNFIRAVVSYTDGQYKAVPTGPQKSGMLSSMCKANGLIVIPEDVERVKKGEEVIVELL